MTPVEARLRYREVALRADADQPSERFMDGVRAFLKERRAALLNNLFFVALFGTLAILSLSGFDDTPSWFGLVPWVAGPLCAAVALWVVLLPHNADWVLKKQRSFLWSAVFLSLDLVIDRWSVSSEQTFVERQLDVPVRITLDDTGTAPVLSWKYVWSDAEVVSVKTTDSNRVSSRPEGGQVTLKERAFALNASRGTDGQAHLTIQGRASADKLVLEVPDNMLKPCRQALPTLDRHGLKIEDAQLERLMEHVGHVALAAGIHVPVEVDAATEVTR